MLHRFSDATDFDLRRQMAELELVTSSPTAAKNLAEDTSGCPSPSHGDRGFDCQTSLNTPGVSRRL